ncbi:hypothetical protein MMC13_003445 [Lambiella insularis]|nr:hypothetical protein [Lambiella insularis]
MEDINLFDELKQMAQNATEDAGSFTDEEPSTDQIARWQHLFHHSRTDAAKHIKQQRNDLNRHRVSDYHWKYVQLDKEAAGYDREAYEHDLQLAVDRALHPLTPEEAPDTASYLFKLTPLLASAAAIQTAFDLPTAPAVRHGAESEAGFVRFAEVDGRTKNAIKAYLHEADPTLRSMFIRICKAAKDFSSTSSHPTLGVESSLPQHRLSCRDAEHLPAQNEFPVWYFFYGSLADDARLSRLLGVAEAGVVLKGARVAGGVLTRWGDYKALVDGPADAWVDGVAFEVRDQEQEDALRVYETEAYEVVRCGISVDGSGGRVQGCTFRHVASVWK